MEESYLLAVDQSTQATKAIIFDCSGRPVYRVTKLHKQIYPSPGFVEHDPLQILENTKAAIYETICESHIPLSKVASLSITNQRETILAWDANTGLPVYNALVWQDERGIELCNILSQEHFENPIREKTGLKLDPYFSATKLAWIVKNSNAAKNALKNDRLMAGTIDTWLIWNLTDRVVFATDYSNASRTMLFNIKTLDWDEELVSTFGLSGILLPEPRSSDSYFGDARIPGFDRTLPITSVMGDSHAALFGHNGWNQGDIKATYGTGSSIMMNIGSVPDVSKNDLVISIGWGFQKKISYVLEGNIHSTGYTLRWLRDNLGLFSSYDEAERLAEEVPDNGGVYLVPAFSGLGAPYWEHYIRAILTGLSYKSDKRHVIRAGLESIAFQIRDLIVHMSAASSFSLNMLHVDGGPTRNAFLMQFQADLLGIPVVVPALEELSAFGAAYMGGISCAVLPSPQEKAVIKIETKQYSPMMKQSTRQSLIEGWKSAVLQTISRKVDQPKG
jgi:glycerol kinase